MFHLYSFHMTGVYMSGILALHRVIKKCSSHPTINYFSKVNNRNNRKLCKIYSKLTIKTLERRRWRLSGVFIVNIEHISKVQRDYANFFTLFRLWYNWDTTVKEMRTQLENVGIINLVLKLNFLKSYNPWCTRLRYAQTFWKALSYILSFTSCS